MPQPRRPRAGPLVLAIVTSLYLAWTLVPLLLVARASVSNAPPDRAVVGFSLRWYIVVLEDPGLRAPLVHSLELALLTAAIAVPLALGLAVGLSRSRGHFPRVATILTLGPLVVPETILATGFFVLFVHLFTGVRLTSTAQLLGHVTLVLPFATLISLSTLLAMQREYEEAAADLGANPLAALRLVVMPLMGPAILAAAAITFALSLNDLVMSHFLCIDTDCRTVPMVLFGAAQPTPPTSALAVLLVILSAPPVILAWVALRWWSSIGSTPIGSRTTGGATRRRRALVDG